MIIHVDHQYKIIYGLDGALSAKRGDSLELSLVFYDEKGKQVLPDFYQTVFGAKEAGDYSGDYLVYGDRFYPDTLDNGQACLSAVVQLNSEALAARIGEGGSMDLEAEFEFNRPGWKASTPRFTLLIENDVIKGREGVPSGTTPDYATREYVDESVSRKVDDVIGGTIEGAEEIASRASASARDSQRFADSAQASAASASGQAALAEDGARTAGTFSELSRAWAEGAPAGGSAAKTWAALSEIHAIASEGAALRAEAAADQSGVREHNENESSHLSLFDQKAEKSELDELRVLVEQAGNMAEHNSNPLAHAALLALKADKSEIPRDTISRQKLDELFAASFALKAHWQKLSSGFIIQYGFLEVKTNGACTIIYPIAFPRTCLVVLPVVTSKLEDMGTPYSVLADNYTATWAVISIINYHSKITGISWMALGF